MTNNTLLIFVKNKIPGKVKTRLAASVGDVRALEIYHLLCEHTSSVCSELNIHKQVWYSDFIQEMDEWTKGEYEKCVQTGEDLGTRLKIAFENSLKNANKTVVIGTDCPILKEEHIHKALDALDYVDVVIGPALDGGYYLLGMKKMHSELFEEIEWSSEKVLRQTLQAIGRLNLSCKLLERLSDIDYIEDWEKYGWELA